MHCIFFAVDIGFTTANIKFLLCFTLFIIKFKAVHCYMEAYKNSHFILMYKDFIYIFVFSVYFGFYYELSISINNIKGKVVSSVSFFNSKSFDSIDFCLPLTSVLVVRRNHESKSYSKTS